MSKCHSIKITTLQELSKNIRSKLNLKERSDVITLGISGPDSFAALIKLIEENLIEKKSIVIPIVCRLPNLLDDVSKELAMNVKILQKYGIKNEVIIKDLVVVDIGQLQKVINEAFTTCSKQITGSNCPGCHLALYYVYGLIAKDLGGNRVISGGRKSHDGKLKINQLDTALDGYRAILKKIGVELLFPLRNVTKKEEIKFLIRKGMGDTYLEIQPSCDSEFGKKPIINTTNIAEYKYSLKIFITEVTKYLGCKKIIIIVLDGAGDEMSKKTSFELANIPNLDYFAKKGRCGLLYPIGKDAIPSTITGGLSLLGYNVSNLSIKRGPIDAIGAKLDFQRGNLTLALNFVSLVDGRIDKSQKLSPDELSRLEEDIADNIELKGIRFRLKTFRGHRGVVVFKSDKPFSANISDTESNTVVDCRPKDNSTEAYYSADIVNLFTQKTHKFLKERGYVLNYVLIRGPGISYPVLEPFNKKYFLHGKIHVEKPAERGISLMTGLEEFNIEVDNNYYSDLAEKIIETSQGADFIYVHIKGPDDPGHAGKLEEKAKVLEDIDKNFFAKLKKYDLENYLLAITCDHATPYSLQKHSADPVPLVIYGDKIDNVSEFNERACNKGSIGQVNGEELMPMLIKAAVRRRLQFGQI